MCGNFLSLQIFRLRITELDCDAFDQSSAKQQVTPDSGAGITGIKGLNKKCRAILAFHCFLKVDTEKM
jgi:hypothetical protein